MLCRLCLEESTIYHNLYNINNEFNYFYEICVVYFKEELEKQHPSLPDDSKLICDSCWSIVKEYDGLRKKVILAHQRLNSLDSLDAAIKLEEVEIDSNVFEDEKEEEEFLSEIPVDVLVDTVLGESKDEWKSELNIKCVDNDENSNDHFTENDDGKDISCSQTGNDDDETDDDKPLAEVFKKWKIKNKKKTTKKSLKGRPRKSKSSKEPPVEKEKSILALKFLENDKFIARWKSTLSCDLCDFAAENFSSLRSHFKSDHETEKCYVKCCGKKYIKRARFVEHIKKHLDPESFKCVECGKCSANSDCLAKHMKTAHGPDSQKRRFQCEICNKGFTLQSVLKRHMEMHAPGQKDHICPHCGKGFVLEKKLKLHIKNIHCATCVCEQCGRSFRNPYALKDHHMQDHQGIQKPKWPCDECPAQLKSKYNLAYHKRTVHHDGSTLYECGECGKVAISEGALLKHKRYVHATPRKYKCTICDKAFKVAQVLREHMTIHTGQELYTCPHCPKTFRVNANMHHHRKRVHPKEWAEKRSERPYIPNQDKSRVSQKVIL